MQALFRQHTLCCVQQVITHTHSQTDRHTDRQTKDTLNMKIGLAQIQRKALRIGKTCDSKFEFENK